MDDKEKLEKIIVLLENSDIVWTRYGADTIEKLAKRILDRLTKPVE